MIICECTIYLLWIDYFFYNSEILYDQSTVNVLSFITGLPQTTAQKFTLKLAYVILSRHDSAKHVTKYTFFTLSTMTKLQQTVSVFAIIAVIYYAAWVKLIPTPDLFHEQILPVLPWWFLVSMGSFALGTLGLNVLTFNDKPEKYQELVEVSSIVGRILKRGY
jgi:dolichol-phosphate mannosyltransferase subunit 3